jgi:pilus assembly protein CpaE
MKNIKVTIAGFSNAQVSSLEKYLCDQPWLDVSSEYSQDDNVISWEGIEHHHPDVVLLCVNENWNHVLSVLPAIFRGQVALVVYGPEANSQAMRMAMQAGARDYVSASFANEDVGDILRKVGRQCVSATEEHGQVTSVINAKGGSGGSFLATSLAHMFSDKHKQHTALLDFDFQYGVQSLSLDVEIDHGIAELLSVVNELDPNSVMGYMSKHVGSVYLLAEKQDHIVLPGEFNAENIVKMINLCKRVFDQIVIDLPRMIDQVFSNVVTNSNNVLLVMQQSVAHVRDVKRLYSILIEELDVPRENVSIIVNRYNDDNSVTRKAIIDSVGCSELLSLTNDYKLVATVTDMAVPIAEYAPKAALTKELSELSSRLIGEEIENNRSMFNKVIGGLLRR